MDDLVGPLIFPSLHDDYLIYNFNLAVVVNVIGSYRTGAHWHCIELLMPSIHQCDASNDIFPRPSLPVAVSALLNVVRALNECQPEVDIL